MFDVAWTDPATETVGQRRQRKEREPAGSQRRGSVKTSSSSASSHTGSSALRSPITTKSSSGWGFFSGKKGSSKGKGKESYDGRSQTPIDEVLHEPPHVKKPIDSSRTLEDVLAREAEAREAEYIASIERPPTPVESVFSVPPSHSGKTESSWGGSISEISSRRSHSTINSQPAHEKYEKNYHQSADMNSYYDDLNKLSTVLSHTAIGAKDEDYEFVVNSSQARFPRAPSSAARSHPSSASHKRIPPRQAPRPQMALPEPPRPDNSAIRLRVRRMEAASSKIVLQRLVEEWDDDQDQAIYNELEFEKQLWMMVGLRFIQKKAGHKRELSGPLEPCKVLSLYENHACANILSTVNPVGSKTHHLSTLPPLNIEQTSHLHTLIVAAPTTGLPYAPITFTTITSLRLPVLLPSSSIPTILTECHRVLKPSGILQLALMDPMPASTSLGPKMRSWIEDHLLLKMDTQFRCLRPTRLMPLWLRDAGFKIEPPTSVDGDSTVRITAELLQTIPIMTNFSFRAVGRGEGGYRSSSSKDKEKESVDMLASTVGRMLWKEIYGPFVVGERWWWEDEEIVDEAYSMGTKWDVMILEAVKG